MRSVSKREYLPVSEHEIVGALLADQRFGFKDRGLYLQQGVCPQCDKKEIFVSKEKPWRLACNRTNNCGWSETTRELYPDLFNNYIERHPPTKADPKATANAYMAHNRQFDLAVIGEWYEQERYRVPESGVTAETVRFYLDEGRTRYWERLIDQAKKDGQRINFGGRRKKDGSLVKGDWWAPPGQTINAGDEVYLVEGIFHAIALHLSGRKACALLMAGNFPAAGVERHINKAIQWRLALDDDKAGRESMIRHSRKLRKLGERCEVILTGTDKDWDDLYRLDRINDRFLGDALWRGRMFTAKNITAKAWAYFAWRSFPLAVLEFNNKLFGIKVDDKLGKELAEHGMAIKDRQALELFTAHSSISPISNCHPEFLYCERYTLTDELSYFFRISFSNASPRVQISFSGSGIESPAAFNKALLTQAAGATFDGNAMHFRLIRDKWFVKKVLHVETVPFVGYDKDSQTYLYQSFAFYKGQELALNEHGFFKANNRPIKTKFRGFTIERGDDDRFNTAWFDHFMKVFGWNGLLCLSFWFGSLFAEQIRAELKSFPFLEITGEHGTGKSTLLEFMWKLFGRDDHEGFDPSKSTFAARARIFMQVSNMPIVLIESDRDAPSAKQKQFDFEELKTAYNGRAIRSLGVFNRGNDVEEPPFRAAIVISQNAAVEGSPALLSRIVQCRFTTEHFTEETRGMAPEFERFTVDDMAGFLSRCLGMETQILDQFRKVYPDYVSKYHDIEEIRDERVVKVHATIASLANALQLVVPELSDNHLQRLDQFIQVRAVARQRSLNSDHPVVQAFWETYDLLHVTNRVGKGFANMDVEHLNHSNHEDQIAINLTHFYQYCVESKVEVISKADMKKFLPGSKSHKFIGQKTIRSALFNRPLWCWIFKARK